MFFRNSITAEVLVRLLYAAVLVTVVTNALLKRCMGIRDKIQTTCKWRINAVKLLFTDFNFQHRQTKDAKTNNT